MSDTEKLKITKKQEEAFVCLASLCKALGGRQDQTFPALCINAVLEAHTVGIAANFRRLCQVNNVIQFLTERSPKNVGVYQAMYNFVAPVLEDVISTQMEQTAPKNCERKKYALSVFAESDYHKMYGLTSQFVRQVQDYEKALQALD